MIITVFGSCRQNSIETYFNTTNIKEMLTYPHYTKEIIQAIEFCNGTNVIPIELTRYIFRSGLLNKRNINCNDFIQQFNNTDLFIIEIASRLCYEYKGYYTHHIAYDDNKYKINDINKRELSDTEIEEDIVKIKNLLYPKKILIIPHIYTRKSGSRYDLVQLLEKLCYKYEIPFLDISNVLKIKNYSDSDIYQSESVLAHFTDYGKNIVAKIYKDKINEITI